MSICSPAILIFFSPQFTFFCFLAVLPLTCTGFSEKKSIFLGTATSKFDWSFKFSTDLREHDGSHMLPARPTGELKEFSFCRLEQGSIGNDVVNLGLFGSSFCQRLSRRNDVLFHLVFVLIQYFDIRTKAECDWLRNQNVIQWSKAV